MITVDVKKCVGCARCTAFCPREALTTWGSVRIDEIKCTNCFGGVYYFEENEPLSNKESILDRSRSIWVPSCAENCPVGALSVVEE